MKLSIKKPLFHGLQRILKWGGIDAFRAHSGYHYVSEVYGRSAHKHADIRMLPGFSALAAETIADGRSQLYYDRLYTLYQALMNTSRLPESLQGIHLAEIGVFRGGTSRFIVTTAAAIGLKTTLHCFDTFEGHAEKDIRCDIDTHKPGNFQNTAYQGVCDYLKSFENVRIYQGRFQDTCHEIDPLKFHIVHLDVDIYAPTAFALSFFKNRMRPGGIIIVDDYGFVSCRGVQQAVEEFLKSTPGFFAFHQLTGQCLLVKHREEHE